MSDHQDDTVDDMPRCAGRDWHDWTRFQVDADGERIKGCSDRPTRTIFTLPKSGRPAD